MTAIITLPGTLSSVPAGMEEAILLEPTGFISRSLESLYLYEEGTGTVLADTQGGANGAIDSQASSNNAYSWLTGGGVQLSGAQLASFPAFEANAEWTLFAALRVVNHTGTAGSEKIVELVGLRNFGAASVRGVALYQRGATDLSQALNTTDYEHRPANGSGGQGTAEALIPADRNSYNVGRIAAISYNGTDTITSRIYDKDAAIIAADTMTVSDAQLFTISGTTVSSLQWAVGGLNATYAGGVVQHEMAARYSREISDFSAAEIAQICASAAALGADRGRAW